MRSRLRLLAKETCLRFERYGISEPKLSSEYLLASAFYRTTWNEFMKDPPKELDSRCMKRFDEFCRKRIERMPIQYIIGEWDFHMLRNVLIEPPVLIPRPETEELVDIAAESIESIRRRRSDRDEPIRILDACSGSGVVGIALLKLFPESSGVRVVGCDLVREAIHLASRNAKRFGVESRYVPVRSRIEHLPELTVDDRDGGGGPFDLIVSNPPYILQKDMNALDPEVASYEDPRALCGGVRGLDVIEEILRTAKHLVSGVDTPIVMEVDASHPKVMKKWLRSTELDHEVNYVEWRRDRSDRPRFCLFRTKEPTAA